MQIARHLSLGTAEIARVLPAAPAGEDLYGQRRRVLPAPVDDRLPEKDAGSGVRAARARELQGDVPHPARPLSTSGAGAISADGMQRDRRLPILHSFSRNTLLTSASFQAQDLGQALPDGNDLLLRAAAVGAYREASSLSVQYLGSFQPIDIHV